MKKNTSFTKAVSCCFFACLLLLTENTVAQNTLNLAGLSSSSPAKVAYSLRKLSSSYSGNAIQVRRSSDNTTQDIGFDGSGDLDQSALTTFVGSGDGYISKWYDQSGNANDAVQSATATQPQIVSSGTVLTAGSRATIMFNGTTFIDGGTSAYSITSARSLNAVYNFQSGTNNHIIDRNVAGTPLTCITGSNQGQFRNSVGTLLNAGSTQTAPFTNAFTEIWDASNNISIFKNGVSDYTGSLALPSAMDIMRIGRHVGVTGSCTLNIWEVILFPSAISTADRMAMECNQQVYYGITTMPAAITGNTTLSTAFTTTLADATSSGTWSSVSTGVATIGTNGVVTGVSAGTSVISYTMPSGCAATTTVTVNTPTSGLDFDGTADYVTIPHSTSIAAGTELTFEAWVKIPSGQIGNIVMKGNYGWGLMLGNTGCSSGNNLNYWTSSLCSTSITSTSGVPNGVWTHVAVVVTTSPSKTLAFYINGQAAGTSTSSSIAIDNGSAGPLILGMQGTGCSCNYFSGQMDEVRVWNVARTQAQIQNNMNCDVAAQSGLVAYYRFNQGTASGTNISIPGIFDYSGNGNCGTLTNFTLTGGSSNYVTGAVGGCNTISDAVPGSFSGNSPVCVGSSITLGNANTGGTWSTASSNIILNSTTGQVTGGAAGSATVNYTLNCNVSSVTVTVNSLPTAITSTGADIITTITGTGTNGSGGDGAAATAGQINFPNDVATDGSGNIYIADGNNNRIRKISPAGIISTIAGTGTGSFSGDGGAATAATINYPTGVAVDGSGNVYIADANNHRIRKINTSGTITTIAGTGTGSFSGDGGAATAANIQNPYGVALDGAGNIYIADASNHRIRKINTSGIITTVAGTGTGSYSGDGGAATAATINNPAGIAIDGSGNLYIADLSNDRVRKVSAADIITTFAGTGSIGYNGDGIAATTANIWNPFGIEIDGSGNVCFSDLGHYRIRKVSPSGIISTFAGTGTSGFSGDGGAATAAQMNYPYGIAIDGDDNVYFADPNNSRIRKVSSGTRAVCVGSSITLTNATGGGTWSASNSNVSLSGTASTTVTATGVSGGIVNISYTLSTGCYKVTTVTVNALPTVAAITGNTTVSTAITTTLASTTPGGVWASAATGTATVNSTTGVVTGVSAGTVLISYTVTTNGCSTTVTTNVTVNTPQNALHFDGTDDVVDIGVNIRELATADFTIEAWIKTTGNGMGIVGCANSNTSWEAGEKSFYIDGSGKPAFVGFGNNFILSTTAANDGNWHHVAVTWDHTGGTSGTGKMYIDGNDVSTGVTYAANNTNVGTFWIGRANFQGGEAPNHFNGTIDEVRIWNEARTQSQIQTNMNCDISQSANLLAYYRLNQGTAGGSNTSIPGALDYSGNGNCGTLTNFTLTGGTSNYVTGAVGGCNTISDAVPGSFSGNSPVCVGSSITLGNANTGGIWSTASGNITLNSTTGQVTGVTAGTATVSYTLNCNTSSVTVTINALPVVAAITGNTTLSTTIRTTLADATGGGVWTSAATGIATINSTSGLVTGVSAGTALISYTVTTSGCSTTVTTNVTVNTPENGLNFDGTGDYVSVSGNTGIPSGNGQYTIEAWIKPTAGGVYGIAGWGNYGTNNEVTAFRLHNSTTLHHYWWFNDLSATVPNLVDGNWHHVACTFNGTTRAIYCDGALVASDAPSGHNVTITNNVTVGRTYTAEYFPGGLDEVRIWNVGRTQTQIQNNMNCDVSQQAGLVAYYRFNQGTAAGTNTGLACAYDYSGNANTGTLNTFTLSGSSSNYVTGAVGNCNTATPIAPGSFSGNTPVCVGQTITLGNANTGGVWSTASGNITLNSTTGLVTGVTGGTTATVNYTLNCSTSSVIVTINALPSVAAITGTTTLTLYNTTTLSDATSSGVWSSAATGVATINSTSGIVTGVSEGTALISYTVTNGSGCTAAATTNVTVSGYNGIKLDGTNDYFITPNIHSAINGTSVTIELWFKANAAGIIVNELGSPGVGSGWHDSWIEVLGTGEVKVRVWSLTSVSLGFITFGTWHHVVLRHNATTNKLDGLLDGVASSGSSSGARSTSGAVFLAFGIADGQNLGSGAYLDGIIDEVRIWNRALCDGEINNNMTGRLNGPQTGLVAYYTLDQGIGGGTNTGLTTAIDYSGNGLNATLVNSALSGSTSNWITGTVNALAPVYTAPTISAGSNVTICNGSSTSLTASGGTSYRWSPSTGLSATTGSSVTANPTSTITYTVTDVCGGTATVQVSVNPLPTVSGSSNTAICIGSSTGLSVSGASAYVWAPAASLSASTGTNVTATPTVTTIYTVTGTSAIGCSNTATITVTVTPYSGVYSITGGGPYCSGTAGATIGLSNSDAGYNYQLIKGGTTLIGSPVAGTGAAISFGAQPLAGLYTATVTSVAAPGCANSMSGSTVVSILTSPAPVAMIGGGSVCGGGPGVMVGLAGSAIGIQYQLYRGGSPVGGPVPGAGTSINFGTFTTLGTYTAIATNTVNACTSNMTGSAIINAAAGITTYTVTGTGSYCSGGTGVVVGQNGSTSGISYQLFLGSSAVGSPVIGTGSAISFGLQTTAGTYTVVGTNTSTGCFGTMTGSAVITIDPLPNAYLVTGGGVYCSGGTGVPVGLSLSQTGVDYQLYLGATPTGSPVAGTGSALSFGSQTAAGTYTIVATNTTTTCNNTMSGSVAVSINPLPSVSAGGAAAICNGSSAVLTASGTVDYTWAPAATLSASTGSSVTASPSSATTYTVTGTDANGCVNTSTVTVTVNALPTVSGGSDVAICNGASTGLTASGASTYTWDPAAGLSATTGASVTATPTVTTTYTVTGTDANGCVNSATVIVTVNPIPTVSGGSNTAVCNGFSTLLTASGATTYTWMPSTGLSATTGTSVTASPTVAVTYTVTGNALGCTNTATVTVSVNSIPSYNAGSDVAICAGTSTSLAASELAAGNAITFPGSGSNYVSIPNTANLKLMTSNFTVSAWIYATSTSGAQNIIYHGLGCSSWSSWHFVIGGAESVTFANKIVFGFRTSNGAGLNEVASPSDVPVNTWTQITGTYDGSNLRLYVNGSLVATAAASGTPWNSGENLYLGMDPGCSGRNRFTGKLDGLQVWNTTRSASDIATYYNQYVAPGTSGIIGSWAFDESSGTTVTDLSSASNNGTIVGSLTREIPSTAPIYGSGSSTYAWAPSATLSSATGTPVTASPTVTTTYTVTGTDANGCSNTASVTVTVNAAPTIGVSPSVAICTGSSTALTATGGISYTWAPATGLSATTGASVTANPTTTTTYTVTGANAGGCTNMATVTVTVNPLPSVGASAGGVYCSGSSTTVTASGATSYTWTPATNLSATTGANVTASPTVTTTYTVTGTDANGCSNTATVVVTVNPLPTDHAMSGGGSFCSATSGTAIGLSGSDVGVNYQLYNASLTVGSPVAGTGSAISFGLHTASGVYSVIAVNTTTGCTRTLSTTASLTSYPSPAPVAMTGGGSYCTGGTGVNIGLVGSAVGVNYQLYLGATPVGSPVAGVGSSISFGSITTAGTYTVTATNPTSGCSFPMSGSATVSVYAALTTYTVTGGGSYCSGGSGVTVGLSSSSSGVNYQLYRGGSPLVGTTVAGTGAAISFGSQTTAGTYTVVATHATNGCTANMSGNAIISVNALPTAYTVTGGGSYCTGGTGMAVGLSNSDAGIDYQLYRSGSPVGSPVAGTGAAISFGTHTTAGIYTVVATNTSTSCTNNMSGSATIAIYTLPPVYTVSGGGSYCSGPGLHIYLGGSGGGTNYQLYNGATPVGSPVAGTGTIIDFGAFTTPGTYTVVATNTTTSCTSNMTGSATIIGISLPTAYTVTGGGTYCSGGTGFAVGLSSSDAGINYQLFRGATSVGSPVAGTGSAISFGLQTTAGTYTVVATNASLGCTSNMTGSAVIVVNNLPAVVSMTGGGAYCSGGTGVNVGLSGSAVGIDYQLYRGGSPVGSPVTGTGTSISYGLQTTAGTYTAVATNTVTACTSNMSGTAVVSINSLPTVYTVTGGGNYCSGGVGVVVGLSNSQVGVNYQLFLGATPVGSPVSGSGIAITFGIKTAAGTYTVVATNASTGCVSNMSGSATITIDPLPTVYNVTGGGAYCTGGSGAAVGLSNSDIGINYQLYNGAVTVGSPVAGTGSAISFGTFTLATTYTVTATDATTGCTRNMSGSASITINSLPAPVPVTGGGTICIGGTGVAVGLGASITGINYQLYVGATPVGSPVPGVGGVLSFGPQTAIGTYTVTGINATTGCTNNMSGSAVINNYPVPTAFAVTGTGSYCTGGTGLAVGLAGSATGTTYQLYRGATAIGTPLSGTGSALNFGLQTVAGTYTVVGTTTVNGCTGNMSGSAVITVNSLPNPYTVLGGGGYCAGGSGVSITLGNSDVGVDYQLYRGASTVGSPVAGTGSSISFGSHTTAGTYTVVATNSSTTCTGNMTGSVTVTVNALPTAYAVTGGGSYCSGPGVHIYVANSDAGVDYQLYQGATPVGSPVAGTGTTLDMGGYTTVGTYSVTATNATTGCTNNMTGSASITGSSLPAVYTVTGGGNYCSGGVGSTIGLNNSDVSVNYQLYLGASTVGSPVAGTGTSISFGPQTAAGTYTVLALNLGSSCTQTMSGSATVTIDPPPASYTVSGGGSLCAGSAGVSVSLSSSDAGVSYQLYNGASTAGSPMSGTGGALNFGAQTAAGTYTVIATDISSTCSATMTGSATVTVNALPTVTTGAGSVICATASAAVTASGAVSYTWAPAGTLSASTGASVTATPTVTTTYTVTGTNANGCINTATVTVTVNPLPTDYAFTGGGTFCAGGAGYPVGLVGSDVGVNYQLYWTSTTGTIAVGSAVSGTGAALSFGTHTLTGTYTVIATNTTTGCTLTLSGSTTIVVNAPPAPVTVLGGGSYCSGGSGVSIGLAGSAVGVNYQLWLGATPVGSPVAGVGSSINFGAVTTAGTYSVTATSTTTGCSSNMSNSVTVSVYAPLTVYTVTGGGNYCSGTTGVTVGLSGSSTGVSYQLYRGGSPLVGTIVSGTGAAISFGTHSIAGIYTVVATNSSTSCTANMSGSATISVNALPTAFTVTGGGSYCSGGTGVAVGLSGSTAGVNYQLYRGGTPAGSPVAGTGSAITFGLHTMASTYTVVATNATTGCTANMTGSVTISINTLPFVFTVSGGGSYCAGGSTGPNIFLGGSAGHTTYQLYLGSAPVGSPVAGTGATLNFGTFTTVGTYSVSATSTITGCTNGMSGTATVSTIALPVVYTVTGGGSYCTGSTGVTVGLSGSNTGITYQLYRGATYVSSLTGTGSPLSFGTFTTAGTYTVLAFVTGTFCTSTMSGSATVVINSLPSAFSITGGGSYCTGGSGVAVGLSSSVTGTNYQLYRSGSPVGSPVAGTGTVISFGLQTTAGTYTAVATNTVTGCSATMTGSATVAVNALPTVFTVTGGGSYCTGGSGVAVGLNGSQAGVSYQLYIGGSPTGSPVAGTGSAISFGFKTTAGTYTVVATNSSTTCTSNMTGSATVSINALPTVYTVTGGGAYCSGGAGSVIGLSGSQTGVNYQLYRGATTVGSPVAGTGSAISFPAQTIASTYTVKATNTTTGCLANMTGSATVSINSAPTVCSMTGGGSYCSGGTGVSVGLGASISGVSYQLYLGGSPVGSPVSGIGAGFSFGLQTAAGTYTAVATNTAGCSSTMSGSIVVSVNSLPAAFTVTGGGGYCSGSTGVSIGLSGSVTGTTYKLYQGATPVTSAISGTGGALNFGTYTSAGTYTVKATITGTGCVNTMTGSAGVTVNPVPTYTSTRYTVAPAGNITLNATPTGGTWTVASTAVATIGSASGIVTGVALGSTTVTYTLSTGCFAPHSLAVTPTGFREAPGSTTGVQNVPAVGNIYLIPNPTRSSFTIKGSLVTADKEAMLHITNMLGQAVYAIPLEVKDNEINGMVQLPYDVPNGMYLVTLRTTNDTKTFHLVIEK